LQRHPFARLAWSHDKQSALLHVSGDSHAMSSTDAKWLCHNTRIGSGNFHRLSKKAQEVVAVLYSQGIFQTDVEE
jgi:hypothetical protein